jgi:hypothetical protein
MAQVRVDKPLVFTSSDSTQRQIDGLAPPAGESDLIDLGTARSGSVQLAQVGGTAAAITLAMDPPATAYADGLLVRFIPTVASSASVTLNVNGLGARKLLRPDLLPIALGQLVPGQAVEAQFADSVFILLGRAESGCPGGYLPVNDHFCVQQADVHNQTWFQGVRYCHDRGARLCTWDEYYQACTVQGANMTGMFDDWEWFDDTADHTHTAVQGGRYQCKSERSIGAVDAEVHTTRCCYLLR